MKPIELIGVDLIAETSGNLDYLCIVLINRI